MALNTTLSASIECISTTTDRLGGSKSDRLLWSIAAEYLSGTSDSQADLVYATTLSLTGSAQSLDLRGSLTDEYGNAVVFVEVCGFAIKNNTSTAGYVVQVGNGTAPWYGFVSASTATVPVHPSGIFIWTHPVAGSAVTATTADILKFDPGANTVSVDVIVWGRSA